MRKVLLLGLVLLAVRPLLAAPDLPILDPARVTEKTLPNGLKVVVKEERQWPVVAIGAYIKAGSLYEAAGEAGAAHLVEHMLFETDNEAGEKLAPLVESLGGRIGATTLRDFVQVNIVVGSNCLEQVLPALLRAVFESGFSEQQMMREMAIIKREMADRDDRADLVLDEMIWKLALPDHPYGRPIGGTEMDLATLNFDKLMAFKRKFYVPNNVALVAVGDVEPAWLEAKAKELTAAYPAREVPWQPPAPAAPLAEPRVTLEELPREITVFSLAWHAPSVADKADVCAMDLIYTVLGQGAIGRLSGKLVNDQKVLLSAEVEYLTQAQPGLLIITALAHPAREIEAQAAILAEVKRLTEEPLAPAELERAKRLLYTEYAFSNESYDDQVGSMGFYAAIDSYRFALEYINQVMQVTPEQLRDVARKYLTPQGYSLAVLRGKVNGKPEEAAMLP